MTGFELCISGVGGQHSDNFDATIVVGFLMGQSWPLFVYFRPFSIPTTNTDTIATNIIN